MPEIREQEPPALNESGRGDSLPEQSSVSRRTYGAVVLGRHFSLLHPERPDAREQFRFDRTPLLRVGPVEGASFEVLTDRKLQEARADFTERLEADFAGCHPGHLEFLAVPSPCGGGGWR